MLRLDPNIIPDPSSPHRWDAYGSAPGKHELVVDEPFVAGGGALRLTYFLRGDLGNRETKTFAAWLASAGLQPTGRMTSEPLPVGPRIEPGEAFHAYVEPGSFHEGVLVGRREALDPPDGGLMENEHRLLARTFGPILRMIRERHHVTLGQLARALGCQTAALSAFELGERPGDPQPLGTSEMDRTVERSMHPNGRCTCGGERTCAWCKMDEAGTRVVLLVLPAADTSEEGERIYSLLQTIEEAAGLLDNQSIVSDTQHLQEAMQHASKHLRKALPTG